MSESASALFSIADAGEFRFARFYIVCEEVPLGTPESPLIVCGLSDTLRECPNVAKTRNGMPAAAWKKYVNFASKNLPPSVYSGTFLSLVFRLDVNFRIIQSEPMRILYFELYCIPCHWAVVSVLSDCLFYDILLIFVSFLPFIFIVPLE